jgi:hypothetical protein
MVVSQQKLKVQLLAQVETSLDRALAAGWRNSQS